jgi:hypothetical protein
MRKKKPRRKNTNEASHVQEFGSEPKPFSWEDETNRLYKKVADLTEKLKWFERELEIVQTHRETLMHGQVLFRAQVGQLQKWGNINPAGVDLNLNKIL